MKTEVRNAYKNTFYQLSMQLDTLTSKRCDDKTQLQYLKNAFGLKNEFIPSDDSILQKFCLYWDDRTCRLLSTGVVRERGARLEIGQSSSSYLYVRYFPACTDLSRHEEDWIELFNSLHPWWYKRFWVKGLLVRVFCSYSLVTSLDGVPSIADRLRTHVLRIVGKKVVGGVQHDSVLKVNTLRILCFFITFVCSSIFVYILQRHDEQIVNDYNKQQTQNELVLLQSINDELMSVKNSIDTLLIVNDSLIIRMNDINKTLQYGLRKYRIDPKQE